MTTINYNDRPMTGITESDYETLSVHLADQLATAAQWADYTEAHQAASDSLANTWLDNLTAREWLAAAGERLGVDTSGYVGV